ncbi:MAG: folate-binding protein [Pseudomonadota bacterium]
MYYAMIDRERCVLRLSGADARDFLQDIVTNDVTRLSPGRGIYAALLTPQGKYLFDFVLYAGGDAILLETETQRAAALAQRLTMYRLRRDVTIEATDLAVVLVWNADLSDDPHPAQMSNPAQASAPATAETALAVPDPRHPGLGWRLLSAAPDTMLAGLDARIAEPSAYHARRIALGVPHGGAELLPEETFILEVGFERFHGVDFKKGCYVGQEVTARMKHKTELRKGLARVAIEGAAQPGVAVTAGEKTAGTLHSVSGSEGLAHLRFDRTGGEMRAGEARLRLIERI